MQSSNSNLDLVSSAGTAGSNPLRQKHLQHKQLDKFATFSAKRAQSFKNSQQQQPQPQQQQESLLKLVSRSSKKNNDYAATGGNDDDSLELAYDSTRPGMVNRNSIRYFQQQQQSGGGHHHKYNRQSNNYRNSSTKSHTSSTHSNSMMYRNRRERSGVFKHVKSKSLEGGGGEDADGDENNSMDENGGGARPIEFSPEIIEAADKVTYITNHIKSENDYEEVRNRNKKRSLYFLIFYLGFSSEIC